MISRLAIRRSKYGSRTTPLRGLLKALLNGRLDLAVVTTPFELNDTSRLRRPDDLSGGSAGGSEYRALPVTP